MSEGLIAPGISLLLDGNVRSGALHLPGGVAARLVLGPVGALLAAANSYSQSTTGKNLLGHFHD